MAGDKRNKPVEIPENPEDLLNEAQIRTLRGIGHFGWQLHFVRRPLFQDPIPVLFNKERNKYIILENDGSINEDPDIEIRESVPAPEVLKKLSGR